MSSYAAAVASEESRKMERQYQNTILVLESRIADLEGQVTSLKAQKIPVSDWHSLAFEDMGMEGEL